VRVAPGTPHLCYCMTPMRYVWDLADQYLGRGALRVAAAPLAAWLRRWDVRTSSPQRITEIAGISQYIAARIRRTWGRDARVIYPGVDVARFRAAQRRPEDFFFMLGGFVPYKAEDLAIEAFRALGLPLVVAGDGPTRARIQASAPANVRFLGRVSDAELESLFARCRALVYPQEEDFGITAVEAQAAGAPVIAFGRGGAVETVVGYGDRAGRAATGVHFPDANAESLARGVREFIEIEGKLDPLARRANAERFSLENFRSGLRREIDEVMQ